MTREAALQKQIKHECAGLDIASMLKLLPFSFSVTQSGVIEKAGPSLLKIYALLADDKGTDAYIEGYNLFRVFTVKARANVNSVSDIHKYIGRKFRLNFCLDEEFTFLGKVVALAGGGFFFHITPTIEPLTSSIGRELTDTDFSPADLSLEARILVDMQQYIFQRSAEVNREYELARAEAEALADEKVKIEELRSLLLANSGNAIIIHEPSDAGVYMSGNIPDPELEWVRDLSKFDAQSVISACEQRDLKVGPLRYLGDGPLVNYGTDVTLKSGKIILLRGVKLENGSAALLMSDLTEMRQAELRDFQVDKMEALGLLTSGIAHDFNNLLAILGSGIELLRESEGEDTRLEIETMMEKTVHRAGNLVGQLLDYSRKQGETAYSNVQQALNAVESMLIGSLGPKYNLQISHVDEYYVPCHADHLQTSLINLVINSRDAMPSGGAIQIDTRSVKTGGSPFLEISVKDQGTGIKLEHKELIFKPFFTTKDRGKGTGLGLSMAMRLAQQIGGNIRIEDNKPQGTIVIMRLPLVFEKTEVPTVSKHQTKNSLAGKFMVVVEDEAYLGAAIERFGKSRKMEVQSFESYETYRSQIEDIKDPDIILTDYLLADGNGDDVFDISRSHWPRVPIILMSGNYDKESPSRDFQDVVDKPFSLKNLNMILSEALT